VGLAIPLRDINRQHPDDGVPCPSSFRPRRFSRPRRLAPPPTLQVYFTLQPRPGFTLQGLPLPPSRETSSVPRALSSLAADRYRQFGYRRHDPLPHPQGLDPSGSPLLGRQFYPPSRLVPLLSFSSTRFSLPPPRGRFLVSGRSRSSDGARLVALRPDPQRSILRRARLSSLEDADLLEVPGLPPPPVHQRRR